MVLRTILQQNGAIHKCSRRTTGSHDENPHKFQEKQEGVTDR